MANHKPHILLTNDDGIRSPGLWTAAQELAKIGYVTVAAPREQSTGMGRSLPSTSDGIIRKEQTQVNGQLWTVYAVGGSPAQAVLHALYEIMDEKPDLVVSGINYGENVGTGITISGTVGAAMEAAAAGIPALAMSLQLDMEYHLSHSDAVDFSTAGYFTAYFAQRMLSGDLPTGVDLLKVDVPSRATPDTAWQLTKLSHLRYYEPVPVKRENWETPGSVSYRLSDNLDHDDPDSDIYTIRRKHLVSVTPLNLDMTARTGFDELERRLRNADRE